MKTKQKSSKMMREAKMERKEMDKKKGKKRMPSMKKAMMDMQKGM